MATSLETRAPFLDVDVMELAFSMPAHLKIRDGERKWVLKQAMRGILPDAILAPQKEGLQHPDQELAAARAAAADADLLAPERIARPRAVRSRRGGAAGRRDTSPAARTTPTRCSR